MPLLTIGRPDSADSETRAKTEINMGGGGEYALSANKFEQ